MNEEVIKSFLVSIGYQTDETSLRKFTSSLESVTKKVFALGTVIAATATAVVTGVKIISGEMERLYYASQRTGETVGNIMSLRYAAGQIGLTADQAQASLEGFTRTLRLNPGMNGLLSQLGVTGNSPLEQFESFIGKLKEMKPYIAAQYAALFGIDPDTLLMLENGLPKLQAEQERYRQKLAAFGIDPEQAAAVGRDFDNVIRRVKDTFNDLWIVIQSRLAPVLTPLIDQFDRWAQTHAGEIAQGISDAVQSLANWIQSVDWKKVGDDLHSVFDALGGIKGILIGMAAIALTPLITSVLGLAGALVRLGGAGSAAGLGILGKLGIAGLASYAGLQVAKAAGLPDVDRESGIKDIGNDDWLSASTHLPAGDLLKALWQKSIGKSNDQIIEALRADNATASKDIGNGGFTPDGSIVEMPSGFVPDGTIVDESAKRAPRGVRNNNPGNIEYGKFTRSMGATGSDGRFAVFESMEDGIRAAVELLKRYAAQGVDTVQSIISKWAPSKENNTKAYVDSVAKQLGVSPDVHLNIDQLSDVANAIFKHENGSAFGKLGVNSAPSTTKSVTVSQKTDVHVHGSPDPGGTARSVAREQGRVNADLVRNMTGAYV